MDRWFLMGKCTQERAPAGRCVILPEEIDWRTVCYFAATLVAGVLRRISIFALEFTTMKRIFLPSLAAAFALTVAGCGETAKVQKQETIKTPGGSTTTTDTHKVESSGSNPPANASGEKAK